MLARVTSVVVSSADYSAVVNAWYDTRFHQVGLEFRTGAQLLIPQRLVPGLESASVPQSGNGYRFGCR